MPSTLTKPSPYPLYYYEFTLTEDRTLIPGLVVLAAAVPLPVDVDDPTLTCTRCRLVADVDGKSDVKYVMETVDPIIDACFPHYVWHYSLLDWDEETGTHYYEVAIYAGQDTDNDMP